jgi:hypothetical protein
MARETKSGSATLDNGAGFAELYLDTIHETIIVAAECHECDTILVEDEEWVYGESDEESDVVDEDGYVEIQGFEDTGSVYFEVDSLIIGPSVNDNDRLAALTDNRDESRAHRGWGCHGHTYRSDKEFGWHFDLEEQDFGEEFVETHWGATLEGKLE